MAELEYKLNLHELGLINNQKRYGCLKPIKLDGEAYPCGGCALCQAKRRRDWSFRLGVELRHSVSAYFLTMTYDDINMPRVNGVGTLHKRDCQLFMKRLRNNQRKLIAKMYKCTLKKADQLVRDIPDLKIKYYLVGEYGEKTRRPHYHALLFNVLPTVMEDVNSIWQKGSCVLGDVTPLSINYCTKYMLKQQFGKNDWREKPFSTMSRRPAIGMQYLKYADHHKQTGSITVRNVNGNFQAMPRFYRDRIWIEKQTRMQVIDKAIQEFKEKKDKEIKRLRDLGQLTPELELSKIRDIQRRKEKVLNEINTF